jgi:hypothetical protein
MSLKIGIGVEVLRTIVKVGGILAMVLGVIEAIKAVIGLVLVGAVGGLVSSFLPAIGWLVNLLAPIGYAYLVGLMVIGIIISVVGYNLYKLGSAQKLSPEDRNKWIVILVILLALSLIAGATYVTIAFVISLIGLILLPTEQVSPQIPSPAPVS